MATRMQQRRGTSEQWSTANPILAAGEIGYETDTNEFRIGDGINRWADLSPFKNLQDLGGTLDDYIPLTARGAAGGVASLDLYGTIPVSQLPNADALDAEVDAKVLAHKNLTQGIHGIDDTSVLATFSYVDAHVDDAIDAEETARDTAIGASASSTYNSATSYADTAIGVAASSTYTSATNYTDAAITTETINRNDAIDAALTAANGYTDSEISELSSSVTDDIATAKGQAISTAASDATSKVATEITNRNSAISTHNSATTSVHGIADTAALATKVYADNAVSTHEADTTNVHGITNTAALATKSYADNAVSTHEQDTTNIHGIADTSALATKAYADNAASVAVAAVIDSAPAALDTLNELAAALGDNANYATTITNALALKAPLASPTFTGTVSGITKAMVGLGNVENTADADKPVSSAAQTALDLKATKADPTFTGTVTLPGTTSIGNVSATEIGYVDGVTSAIQTQINAKLASSTAASTYAPIASPTFTGTVSGVTKTHVGLGNADNTSDANKPVSTATQTALDAKAPLASPTFTGTVAGVTKSMVGLGNVDNTTDANKPVSSATQTALDLKAPLASPTFTGTVAGITKAMVGLANVDNTSDANKPVSTATQAALDLKANSEDITELSQDAVNSALTAGSGITKTYNDSANTITVAVDSTIATKTYADGKASDAQTAAISAAATDATTKANAAKTYADGLISTEVTNRNSAITTAVAGVVGAAPAALDTLKELADALTADESTASTLATLVGTKAPIASPTFTGTVSGITKSMVGLGSVDNTADTAKPVSTAQQTALDLKLASATAASTYAPIASPTFTGTVSGVTKSMVGLGSVDNTADTAKPVSTAQQTALDLKANLASPTFTGTVAGITKTMVGLGSVDNTADSAKPVSTATQTALDAKAPLASPTFTGTVSGVTKAMVGLGSVDNTSDASKPVSTATQTALDAKAPLASPTFTGTVTLPTGTVTSGMILDGTIVDADINASAAIAQSKISGLSTSLGLKADLASPTFTGTPLAPTASAGTSTTQVATTAFVGTAVANLVASAPAALDTLNELAAALGNDASFSTTLTNNLALKAPKASPSFTGGVTVDSSGIIFTDGTQTKEGVPSRTPIQQKTGSYTLSALTERDNMIEVSSATAVSITIPLNSAVAYPVGTSIDILQTSTGQVTIAGAAGVTVNATPGLKLRTQWSSATLFKRASDTWVVYGDLTA